MTLIAPAAFVAGLVVLLLVRSYARHRWISVRLPREARRRGVCFARLALCWRNTDVAFAELESAPALSDDEQVLVGQAARFFSMGIPMDVFAGDSVGAEGNVDFLGAVFNR